MKSKTSFINRGILHNDLKSFGWIGAAYLLGLLLAVPLQLLMIYSRQMKYETFDPHTYLRVLNYGDSGLVIMLIVLVPILAGLWLFRYLQADKTADMIHALPVKRETLYNTHVLSGIILLFIPLIITALVLLALVYGLGIEDLQFQHILSWLGVSLLLNLLFFMATVFTGICTGISVLQGILTLILLVLPTGLLELLLMNGKIYIYGFANDFYSGNTTFSPLLRMTELNHLPLQAGEIAGYILAAIAFFFLGRYLYQRRQVERAGSAITFNVLRPVFKYGVTFCFMLLLGAYFHDSQQDSMSWTYFGYLLGSVLAYYLIEILLAKSLRVFNARTAKGFGLYLLLMVVLIGGFNYDFTGYEKRQPQLAEVESIYMDYSFYPLREAYTVYPADTRQYGYEYAVKPVQKIFKDQTNIASIHALHQSIISNRNQDKALLNSDNENNRRQSISLAYNLKNGQRIYRQYSIPAKAYKELLKPIYESREYKELYNDIFRIEPQRVNLISISAYEASKQVTISDPAQIVEGINILRQDLLQQSYDDMTDGKVQWAEINLIINNRQSLNLRWEKSFTGFEDWLIGIGKYNQARLIPEQDIAYAIVDINSGEKDTDRKYYSKSCTDYILELEQKSGTLKITDADQLEACLRNYTYYEKPKYDIYYQLKNGATCSGGFTEDNAPDFVKEHFIKQSL